MKKKLALFFTLAILVFSANSMPAQAHHGSKAGAVVAGSLIGLTAGAIIGSTISHSHHMAPPPPPLMKHPRRYYYHAPRPCYPHARHQHPMSSRTCFGISRVVHH